MKIKKALLYLKSLHTLLDNSLDKVYAEALEILIESYYTLEKDLAKQCKQTKAFGDELLYFRKNKSNVWYENKLKKYRDEIVKLKKENKKVV